MMLDFGGDEERMSPGISFVNFQQCKAKRGVFFLGFLVFFCVLGLLSSVENLRRAEDGAENVQIKELGPWRKYFLRNFHRKHYKCSPKDKVQFGRRITGEALKKKRLETGPRSLCKCGEMLSQMPPLKPEGEFLESNCGPEATAVGRNQSVISFSLYRKEIKTLEEEAFFEQRYFKGVATNLKAIKEHYPGWLTRIYTNMTFGGDICDLVCSDASIFFCDVQRFEGASKMHPMTWRFLTVGDHTVTKFLSRDLDSLPTARERSAVAEWESSGFPFHGMRDHPWHGTSILGGMWGADNTKLCYQNGMSILKKIMEIEWKTETTVVLNDQEILTEIVYLPYRSAVLTHDSYLCDVYQDSIPFPTKRPNDYDYIGRPVSLDNDTIVFTPLPSKCPLNCRPSFGLDWEYC